MAVQFKSHVDVVMRQMRSNAAETMDAVGELLVESVQEKMLYGYNEPHGKDHHTEIVDTGALFESIQAEARTVSQNTFTVDVGSDKKYMKYVHDGTSKLKGRPFIRDGVMDALDDVEELMGNGMSKGF